MSEGTFSDVAAQVLKPKREAITKMMDFTKTIIR